MINMNQFNSHNGYESNKPPREWNRQPPEAHFKSMTSPSTTNPVISSIIRILNHHTINIGDVKIPTSDFPVESNSESDTDLDTTPIKSIDDDEMDHLLELFRSYMMKIFWMLTSICFKLYWWLPLLNFFTVSTVLFHKNGGANAAVKNCMLHFSIFVPTKATMKSANGNTVHAQLIGLVLCSFPKCLIIYSVGPIYYCPGQPSNTISSDALKVYIDF